MDRIEKMSKNQLIKRYWLDNVEFQQHIIDEILDYFYKLELYGTNCLFEKWSNWLHLKVNDKYIGVWFDTRNWTRFCDLIRWIMLWKTL